MEIYSCTQRISQMRKTDYSQCFFFNIPRSQRHGKCMCVYKRTVYSQVNMSTKETNLSQCVQRTYTNTQVLDGFLIQVVNVETWRAVYKNMKYGGIGKWNGVMDYSEISKAEKRRKIKE